MLGSEAPAFVNSPRVRSPGIPDFMAGRILKSEVDKNETDFRWKPAQYVDFHQIPTYVLLELCQNQTVFAE